MWIKVTGSLWRLQVGEGEKTCFSAPLWGCGVCREARVDPGTTGGHSARPGTAAMASSEEAAQSQRDVDGLWRHQKRMALVMEVWREEFLTWMDIRSDSEAVEQGTREGEVFSSLQWKVETVASSVLDLGSGGCLRSLHAEQTAV